MAFTLASSAAAANAALDLIPVSLGGGKVRFAGATFTNAAEDGVSITAPIRLPIGARVICGILSASATLGASATLAIGISGNTGKYRAAATHTVTTPTLFGVHAALMTPLTAEEQILVTIATAALPGSGTWWLGFLYVQDN